MIKIMGAGPAGLCAAINLAKAGREVKVFEMRNDVGMRFHPNLQGLKDVSDPEDYMKELNINPKTRFRYFSRAFFGTRKRDIELGIGKSMPFVVRGGKESLEYGLYREALDLGVGFEFNSRIMKDDVDIVAAGHGGACDAAALGMVFEDTDFPRDAFLIIFDDRYSPKGWYSYIVPISDDHIEFVNCVSQPHVPLLKKLTEKALQERKIVRGFLDGKRKVATFGGVGNISVPKTAFINNRYYVGEAAGFQDPFMGFGITYALKSAKMAADAIVNGYDYDAMWKRDIMPRMRKDFARRFPVSIFGDALPEMFMRKYRSGDRIDFQDVIPSSFPLYNVAEFVLFRLEILKKRLTGFW